MNRDVAGGGIGRQGIADQQIKVLDESRKLAVFLAQTVLPDGLKINRMQDFSRGNQEQNQELGQQEEEKRRRLRAPRQDQRLGEMRSTEGTPPLSGRRSQTESKMEETEWEVCEFDRGAEIRCGVRRKGQSENHESVRSECIVIESTDDHATFCGSSFFSGNFEACHGYAALCKTFSKKIIIPRLIVQ